MELGILLLVLGSAVMHPVWNLIVKKNPDPQLAFLCLTVTLCLTALIHGLILGVDFAAVFGVMPLVAMSVCGQILYGSCLTATLRRGDLSAYYPIIRASPVFVVVVGFLFLGRSYPPIILLAIAMTVFGGAMLLYKPGARLFNDPGTLLLALTAMSGTGIYSLADAQLMQTIKPQVLIFVVEALLVPVYATLWLRRRVGRPPPIPQSSGMASVYLLLPGVIAYASYSLLLMAYENGGDVAAVTSVRQASIPISVALGGLFLREGEMTRRFLAAGLLALGIVLIGLQG